MKLKAYTVWCFLACLLLGVQPLWAQHKPADPFGENLFPPELVMQHQKAIGLSQEQKDRIRAEILKAQTRFTELQWELQEEMETMTSLVKQDRVDEQQVLAQLDEVLNLEREIKRTQITLVVRIKNTLTARQQAELRKFVDEQPER